MDRMSTYENSIYYTAGDANRPGELTRDSTLAGSVAAAPKATATALPVVSLTIAFARLLLRDWLRLRRSSRYHDDLIT